MVKLSKVRKKSVVVKGKKKGSAKLQAKVGSKKYVCTIKVKKKATESATTQNTTSNVTTAEATTTQPSVTTTASVTTELVEPLVKDYRLELGEGVLTVHY